MIRLFCVQTYHGHWAGPSGYHNYLPHLIDRYRLDHRRIEGGPVDRGKLHGIEKLLLPIAGRFIRKQANPWTTEKDLLEEFRLSRQVKDLLVNGEQVVVHFMDGEHGYNFFAKYLTNLGPERERLRLLTTYHQPPDYLKKVLPHTSKINKLDLLLTVGTSQIPFFGNLPNERICFVPHGVDTDFFHPADQPVAGEKIYFITTGQWLRDFDALEAVIRDAPTNFIFRLVAVKDILERFRDLPNVELYSGIKDKELRRLYQESHIGLMPLQDATANNSLLEMMACGKPVVVTRVGSVGDYVDDNCCILLPDNAPETILMSLHDLNESTEKRILFGQAARKQALEFSWSRTADRMDKVYRNSFLTPKNS